jgi:hypothetical protein
MRRQDKMKLVRLKKFAIENPVSKAELMKAYMTGLAVVDRNDEFEAKLSDGHRVVYNVETQPFGPCHHVSVSHEKKKPKKTAVLEALELLSVDVDYKPKALMKNRTERYISWFETTHAYSEAFNILVAIDQDFPVGAIIK